jgi:hypothetical protein
MHEMHGLAIAIAIPVVRPVSNILLGGGGGVGSHARAITPAWIRGSGTAIDR